MNRGFIKIESEELKKLLDHKNLKAPEMMTFSFNEFEQILRMCGFPESEIEREFQAMKDLEDK